MFTNKYGSAVSVSLIFETELRSFLPDSACNFFPNFVHDVFICFKSCAVFTAL